MSVQTRVTMTADLHDGLRFDQVPRNKNDDNFHVIRRHKAI